MLTGPSFIFDAQTVQKSIILLHGFGSNGEDLFNLVPELEKALPETHQGQTAYFAPNGSLELDYGGYAWFSDANWTFKDYAGIQQAKTDLWTYMQDHHFPLTPPANTHVLGFSQGAMTALFAAPRWPQPVASIIAHSGRMLWDEELTNEGSYHKIPTLFLHGTEDDVVPADESVKAAEKLQALGFQTKTHLIKNLAHGIGAESLAYITEFLYKKDTDTPS